MPHVSVLTAAAFVVASKAWENFQTHSRSGSASEYCQCNYLPYVKGLLHLGADVARAAGMTDIKRPLSAYVT